MAQPAYCSLHTRSRCVVGAIITYRKRAVSRTFSSADVGSSQALLDYWKIGSSVVTIYSCRKIIHTTTYINVCMYSFVVISIRRS